MFKRKALRQVIEQAGRRICLLLLFVHVWAPMQMVLCHEGADPPRLENSLNGQCLPQGQLDCGGCTQDGMFVAPQPGLSYAAFSPALHSHCSSCTDILVNSGRHASPAGSCSLADVAPVGGCLYLVDTAVFPRGIAVPAGMPELRSQAARLNHSIVSSSRLLI